MMFLSVKMGSECINQLFFWHSGVFILAYVAIFLCTAITGSFMLINTATGSSLSQSASQPAKGTSPRKRPPPSLLLCRIFLLASLAIIRPFQKRKQGKMHLRALSSDPRGERTSGS